MQIGNLIDPCVSADEDKTSNRSLARSHLKSVGIIPVKKGGGDLKAKKFYTKRYKFVNIVASLSSAASLLTF